MDEDQNLARLLLDGFRWFDEALLAALNERHDTRITSSQSLLFADLSQHGVRQADLARSIGVSRQAVYELVRGLEQQGLVKVTPDPTSGRSKLVVPTKRGVESMQLAKEVFVGLEAELRSRIGDMSVDRLRAALAEDWGESRRSSDPAS